MQIIKNADLDPDLAAAHQVEIKPIKLEMMELPGQRERADLSWIAVAETGKRQIFQF